MTLDRSYRDNAVSAARAAAGRRRAGLDLLAGPDFAPAAPRFDQLPEAADLARVRAASVALDLPNPFFRVHEGHAAARSVIGGREVLNFASYDYLGLNTDPRVAEAAKAAIDLYGLSPSGSRLVSGNRPVHDALESALARHYGTEAALTFVSGHSTNVSTIGCLMGEGDLILYDALCHNSIQVGMKLSGATRRVFAHNDMAALETLLREHRRRHRRALIITEGLFSMDGDCPPLAELVALKQQYGCWLMVDEAHALGCVGATGAGSFEAQGIATTDVDIWMGTLSKTLASTGGYIAGSAALVDILRGHASGFVYSVALAPVLAASALRALELMQEEPWRVRALQKNAASFIAQGRASGLDTGMAGPFSIVPVQVGDSLLAAKLSDRLLGRGINVLPVMFPAVPMQSARLRFFLGSLHDRLQIAAAVLVLVEEVHALRAEGFGTAVPQALLSL